MFVFVNGHENVYKDDDFNFSQFYRGNKLNTICILNGSKN